MCRNVKNSVLKIILSTIVMELAKPASSTLPPILAIKIGQIAVEGDKKTSVSTSLTSALSGT